MVSLLPNNTTPLERALEAAFMRFDPPMPVNTLWDGNTCPENMLPWLAWALSVDDWEPDWPIERKRQACVESIAIHEHKGTPSAIKRILAVRGHDDAVVIERSDYVKRNGKTFRDGSRFRGGPTEWATFRVILKRPISIDQADGIYRALNSVKRNCVHLVSMDFSATAIRRNGAHIRNGEYTRGLITTN